MEHFRKLGIVEHIIKTIEEQGFEVPSEIQDKAIPLVLSGNDVIAGSATGSGKTLVFGAGIIQSCEKGNGLQALVLTPTRELAQQITEALRKF
ncbi:MAG: DEAD/DEAH box helicase, partial [Nanoarchaeota archaeon]|nr:DEAD/DEAH box helicase [Nanoarchaeota archaeon]